ncbi:PepSY domain-containing protein [Actinocorallia sp. API 0066]|uniref:PepSY domain-containing protein n=1 Tax=Actinocorallia sp. API 0066 TaxID=2896846 RepID=UPI001E3472A6|nr:PepSY domain-containing protein [Actinocorallia sp. API 0066]MCD0452096.1 PepSY domain-containing protein [Actinocorallia sp. API 0066]
MPAKTVIALAFTATAAAGIAAGTALASADDVLRVPVAVATETPTADPTTPTDGTTPATPQVTIEQAMTKALEKQEGLVSAAELDTADDGKQTWHVDLLTKDDKWRDLEVDATSGEVIEDKEDSGGDQEDAKALREAKVTAADAVTKATAQQPGTVTSLGFDYEDGAQPSWKVDVRADDGAEHEVVVNADSGEVTPSATASPTG